MAEPAPDDSQDDDRLEPIRQSVRALCAKFPGEYWRGLDRERAYPLRRRFASDG